MKIFKLMAIALVALVGLNSCSKDCDHDFIDVDHSSDLVGTWTCLEAGYAEALVIKADGSTLSTGVEDGEYWENVAGNIVVKNGIATMTFEDGDNFEGHIDVIAGMAFSIYNEDGERMTYNYCANDLADELIGMWVCNDSKMDAENDMMIERFAENGKTYLTGILPMGDGTEFVLEDETNYKVVGDLMFLEIPSNYLEENAPNYNVERMVYSENGTTLGDIMTFTNYVSGVMKQESWIRVKETLDLASKQYDYSNVYISNVKGTDKDIPFFNTTLNFAKMDKESVGRFLGRTLFSVQFPNANTIKYSFLEAQQTVSQSAPIVVDGNKMTIKMSENKSVYRDVDLYTFQDASSVQLHMYMPTKSFENFLGNMQVRLMEESGELDLTDAAAVKAVFDNIENAVETINLSILMKTVK